MNRILSLSLILVLLLSCVGCGASPNANQPVNANNAATQNNAQEPPQDTSDEAQPPQEPTAESLTQTSPPEVSDIPDESEDAAEEPYVRTIDPSAPMVALTFDDGPHKTNSHALLDILEENHSVATFFEVARNISQAPDALVRMLEMGCEVGSHSNAHKDLSLMNQSGILADLDTADKAFIAATGQAPTLVRPPYGATNKAVRLGSGRSIIMWTVDTMDWKLKDAQKVTDYIQNYGDLDGQIVLLHSIHDTTIESMKTVIPWLIEQGYQLVTVTELLAYYYGELPEPNKYYGFDYLKGLKKTDTPVEIPEGGIVTGPVEIPVIDVVIPAPSQPVVTTPPADTPPAEEVPGETPPTQEVPPTVETPSDPAPDAGEDDDPNQPPAWLIPSQPSVEIPPANSGTVSPNLPADPAPAPAVPQDPSAGDPGAASGSTEPSTESAVPPPAP